MTALDQGTPTVQDIVSGWMRADITTMRNVISVMMRKGGAGKTSLTLAMADALARFGLNVLVIDMDPQGNASLGLGRPVVLRAVEKARIGKGTVEEPDVVTVVEVIDSGEPGVADEAILLIDWQYDAQAAFPLGGPLVPGRVGTIGLIPAYEALEALPQTWKPADFEKLGSALLLPEEPGGVAPNHRWDVALIDTGIAQLIGVQAAKAADWALFVTQAQAFGTDAIPKTMRLIKDVQANYHHDDLDVMGLVWNEFTDRQVTERELATQAATAHEAGKEHWEAPVWPYQLPNLTVVSKSHAAMAPISAFLSTARDRDAARRVCQVAEAVALRVLDKIEHPQAAETRTAWHKAWPAEQKTRVMLEDEAR